MAEGQDRDQKTESATPKKLAEAKENGDVARSREYGASASVIAGCVASTVIFSSGWQSLKFLFQDALYFESKNLSNISLVTSKTIDIGWKLLSMSFPIILACLIAAATTPVVTGSWIFSSKAFIPNFGRLNPLSWPAKVFSASSIFEIVKSIAKVFIISFVAYIAWGDSLNALEIAATKDIELSATALYSTIWSVVVAAAAVMACIALLDVPYQLHSFAEKLKMTRQEVKEEAKESEGSPEMKQRIKSMQREMNKKRMMQSIPTADVIITNPTHYAVAIKYNDSDASIPKVVAKGKNEVAARIREIGAENNIPFVEAPPLARSLHKHVEIGDHIPETLFIAVAKILAYAFELKRTNAFGGKTPIKPEIEIPEEMYAPSDDEVII